jgi:DNA-binding IscR family transcriptional regulator
MKEVRDATAKILDATSLADLVKRGQFAALGREALEFSI